MLHRSRVLIVVLIVSSLTTWLHWLKWSKDTFTWQDLNIRTRYQVSMTLRSRETAHTSIHVRLFCVDAHKGMIVSWPKGASKNVETLLKSIILVLETKVVFVKRLSRCQGKVRGVWSFVYYLRPISVLANKAEISTTRRSVITHTT